MSLNKNEEKFVRNLFMGDSQRIAYKDAFPQSKKWKNETVDSKACILAKTEKIKARLEELREEYKKHISIDAIMSADEVLEGIKELIVRNIGEDDKTALKGYELYGKYHKLFTDKVEHSGETDINIKFNIPRPKKEKQ